MITSMRGGQPLNTQELPDTQHAPLFKKDGSVAGGATAVFLGKKEKRPQTYNGVRFCPDCGVKLASYNRGPKCYAHSPNKFPRVRGVIER